MVMTVVASGCCSTNDRLHAGMAVYANVIDKGGDFIVRNRVLQDKRLWTRPDGSIDHDKCVEYAKMHDLFQQGFPTMAETLRAWSQDKKIIVTGRMPVDYEAGCN